MSILSGLFADGAKTLGDTVSGIVKDFKADPTVTEQLNEKLQEAIMQYHSDMEDKANAALATVNTTMQTEAKSEHWLQWAWRPLVGLCFVAVIANNYIIMPYFGHYIQPITIPSDIWSTMMVVMGVSAATRGGDKNLLSNISLKK